MSEKIGFLGMSPAESAWGEPIILPTGEVMQVVVEPGNVVCVSRGGIAARYSQTELENIGHGNVKLGTGTVISAIRDAVDFEHGQPRPIEPTEF